MRSDFELKYLKEVNESLEKELASVIEKRVAFKHSQRRSAWAKIMKVLKTNPFVLPDTFYNQSTMKSLILLTLIVTQVFSGSPNVTLETKNKSLLKTTKSRVIAIFKSKSEKISFMQAFDTNQSQFQIKKSFPLVQSQKQQKVSALNGVTTRKQVMVFTSSLLSVEELMSEIKAIPGVESVTEDQIVHTMEVIPNDPKFIHLWGLKNTNTDPITDINVTSAWDHTTGSEAVVVGVIDTGIDYTHTDLSSNIWTNPNEVVDGNDSDGNGYIDDIHGIDAVNDDSNPMDDAGHGTHVAGTIGAEGNNTIGIVGVNWNVKIAACKFLDSTGSGYTSDAIECVNYFNILKQKGVNIVATNNSWGGGGYEQALYNSISAAKDEEILFIAAAGNEAKDIDTVQSYPANYNLPNVVSVAAVNIDGDLAYFSNYGEVNVDIAAPGVNIESSIPRTVSSLNNSAPYFTDDFENGISNWLFTTYKTNYYGDITQETTDDQWGIDNYMSASGSYSLSDSPNNNYYVNSRLQIAKINQNFNFSGFTPTGDTGICLNMKIKGEIENNWDFLGILLSKDEWSHWQTFYEITGRYATWTDVSFIIPEEYIVDSMQIAIYRSNDYSITYQGYNIDDVSVTSCTFNHANYAYYSGTSMAAPHVTGAIALLASVDNNLTASERKDVLLNNVTVYDAYRYYISTSGLLNVGKMIASLASQATPNARPTANAGTDINATVNQGVTIAGTGTDSDGTIVSYIWKEGTTTLHSYTDPSNASFIYTPTTAGDHTLVLTVIDDDNASDSDSMIVRAAGPVANAGSDQTVTVNHDITIAGTGADSNGTIVSYIWKEGNVTLHTYSDPVEASFSYIPTTVGEHELVLTVKNDKNATESDSMIVTAIPNAIPVANAGTNKSITVNNSVAIIGTGTDSDGTIVSYIWKEGATTLHTYTNPINASFTYTPTTVGTHTLTFTVTDNDGATDTDSMIVTATSSTTSSSSGGGGGGCTYNPENTKIDMMYIVLLLLAMVYLWKLNLFKNTCLK